MGKVFVERIPSQAAPQRGLEANVIEAIADWCDALHGDLPLQDAFAALAAGLCAEAGVLVRTHFSDFRPARIAVWDRAGARGGPPLTSVFADSYFGPHVARPRAASIWLASGVEDTDADPALATWQARRGLREFAVLVLSGGPGTRDHIELHFRDALSDSVHAALAAVLPTMSRTWAARQVGLITRTMVNHRAAVDGRVKRSPSAPILGAANPARLSRAEFRVCLLLSRGLSVVGVAEELAVSDATVRSHLRSIYAKTETAGLAELVFRLLRSTPDPAALDDLRCA